MITSVLIPVFNEEATIREIVRRVQASPIEKEIIVVDDGSTDGTPAFLDALNSPDVVIVRHSRNLGKGAAVRTGLQHVRGDIVLIQDADLEYDPSDYPRLIAPILRGDADVVYGSRIKGHTRRGYLRYYLGGRMLSCSANLLYGTQLTDVPTGYKVFKTQLLKGLGLAVDGFGFCAEVTAKAARRGHRIVEVGISYSPRSFKEGKKISWRSGLFFLWTLVRCRFSKV